MVQRPPIAGYLALRRSSSTTPSGLSPCWSFLPIIYWLRQRFARLLREFVALVEGGRYNVIRGS